MEISPQPLRVSALVAHEHVVASHFCFCVEVHFHDDRKNVYRCKVFGSRKSGKTTIVRGLVGKQEVIFTPTVCVITHTLV